MSNLVGSEAIFILADLALFMQTDWFEKDTNQTT